MESKRLLTVLIVSGALVAGAAYQPSVAHAGGFRHRGGGGVFVTPGPFVGRPFPHRFAFAGPFPHARPFFFGHPFPFRRHFAPVIVTPWPTVVYAPPPVVYAPPPVAYAEPPPVAAPPPPPMPTVIQYPHGRYELRGDGIATPYVWVWVPNPPPAPPEAPPAPPQQAPPDPPPAEERPVPAPGSGLYRWIDDAGVDNWTDRLDKIPERYRSRAERLDRRADDPS